MGWSAYDTNANADCGLDTFQVPCLTNAKVKYTARRAHAAKLEILSLSARHHAANKTTEEGPNIPSEIVVQASLTSCQSSAVSRRLCLHLGCTAPLLRSLVGTFVPLGLSPETGLNPGDKKFEFSVSRNTGGRNLKE